MERIERFIHHLSQLVVYDEKALGSWTATLAIYDAPSQYTTKKENYQVNKGDYLISTGETIFLNQSIQVPKDWDQEEYGLQLLFGYDGKDTIHEALVYLNDKPYHGIDRNRSYVPLPVTENGEWDVKVELYNPIAQPKDLLNEQNAPAEHSPPPLYLLENKLVVRNKALEELVYLLKTFVEAVQLLPSDHMNRINVTNIIRKYMETAEHYPAEQWADQTWVKEQIDVLKEQFETSTESAQGIIHLVGQSHIDLAWLWPAKETIRKTSRTFSTMSTLLERYPTFTYAQSQPQAFVHLKEHFPDVYERVKKHIQSDRFELVGGMWVEPDLNIPSGESLVRQLLYGLEFYEKEFGKRPTIEWLPDTFGYSASLPQILKLAGMEYFMTTKMNWNDTNPFPYDLFYWEGIDGTKIPSFLIHGVNEYTHPKEISDHWKSFKQKDVYPEQMLLYGHGDGGGGVTREMLAYANTTENLPGLPRVKNSTAHEFFEGIKKKDPELPVWSGDMYLELHRGTYTTHAYNKKANRYAEHLYREAELWSTFSSLYGHEPNFAELEDQWKLLLFNQFHDIIPGTSIPEVYEQSNKDYEQIFRTGEEIREEAIKHIVKQIDMPEKGTPYVLFNSLSWERNETIHITGGDELRHIQVKDESGENLPVVIKDGEGQQIEATIYVSNIPAMGYKTIWLEQGESQTESSDEKTSFNGEWETEFYQIKWNDRGEITSLFDREENREIVLPDHVANQFQLFHDKPLIWDAWDIDPEFEKNVAGQPELTNIEVVEKNDIQDVLRFTWKISNSEIEQDMVLSHFHKRIDFKTKVRWDESHKLLKVSFPVDIRSTTATYEIPFGTVERATHNNTTWESAQFEVSGHKFADLSEANYGISLLNDSKYGYDIKGQTMRLSLLRAPKWPDDTADIGEHEFTYSLYPHAGSWQEAHTVRRGYELNQPVVVQKAEAQEGKLPTTHSFIQVDDSHVVVDTVKRAENSEGIVVRVYESSGGRNGITLKPSFTAQKVDETNLLEETMVADVATDDVLETELKPYEIKTYNFHQIEES